MSALYAHGKRALLNKEINMSSGGDSISAALVKNTYTFSQNHTSFSSDIGSAAVATAVLSGQSVTTSGTTATFDANDVTFPAVASGSSVIGVVLYHTSSGKLLAWIDSGAGLPITTSGADIIINWSNGTDKIFTL